MAKSHTRHVGAAWPFHAVALTTALLGGCASGERTRHSLFERAHYAPADGNPQYIFVDPVGPLDLTVAQRLGRLDVPTPPPPKPQFDRFTGIRQNYDATLPPLVAPTTPVPVPLPVPPPAQSTVPPVPVPPPAAVVQPPPQPAAPQRRPVMPGIIQPQTPSGVPSEPSVTIVPRAPGAPAAPKPGIP